MSDGITDMYREYEKELKILQIILRRKHTIKKRNYSNCLVWRLSDYEKKIIKERIKYLKNALK